MLIFNHESSRRSSKDLLDAVMESLPGGERNVFDGVVFTTNMMDPEFMIPGQQSFSIQIVCLLI